MCLLIGIVSQLSDVVHEPLVSLWQLWRSKYVQTDNNKNKTFRFIQNFKISAFSAKFLGFYVHFFDATADTVQTL